MVKRIHRTMARPRTVDAITKQFKDMHSELILHADSHLSDAAKHKAVHESAAIEHDKSVAEATRARMVAGKIAGLLM
jgi:hypothetical protein